MSVAFLFNKVQPLYTYSLVSSSQRRLFLQPATEFSVAVFFIIFRCHSERSEESQTLTALDLPHRMIWCQGVSVVAPRCHSLKVT